MPRKKSLTLRSARRRSKQERENESASERTKRLSALKHYQQIRRHLESETSRSQRLLAERIARASAPTSTKLLRRKNERLRKAASRMRAKEKLSLTYNSICKVEGTTTDTKEDVVNDISEVFLTPYIKPELFIPEEVDEKVLDDFSQCMTADVHCSDPLANVSPVEMPARRNDVFSMGQQTLEVPMNLFGLNRERLQDALLAESTLPEHCAVFLKGGDICNLYSSDVEYNVFRQESFFFWAFGVNEPSLCGIMDVVTGSTVLFVPELSDEYTVWMGKLPSLQEYSERYQVKVRYVHEIVDILKEFSVKTLLTLNGVNSDSGLEIEKPTFEGIEKFEVNNEILHRVMSECRVIKTEHEMKVMRYAAEISSQAHKAVMKAVKPGMYEYQCESKFLHYVYSKGGCRHVAYTCICASGPNGGILHYGHAAKPNDKIIRDGNLCTFDMGASYCGYASDITVTFPANGRFTAEQKAIYNAVLAANLAVQSAAKPGVSWVDMHLLANRVMLEELQNIGLLHGNVDDMLKDNIAAVFQPHGLGHLLGLDVHDVGGYIEGTPARPKHPGLSALRTARHLKAGMAITIEPGCYFIDPVLDAVLEDPVKSKYINRDVLTRFRGFGGVRIEDDVFITEDGVENYTHVPRTIEEIENWMRGAGDSIIEKNNVLH